MSHLTRVRFSICLVVVLGTCSMGCYPKYVGLRGGLKVPPDLDPARVKHDPQERKKALDIYKNRKVEYTDVVTLRIRGNAYGRKVLLRGGVDPVHWKEIMEEGGFRKEASERFDRQLGLRWGVSLGLLVAGVGMGIGALFLFQESVNSSSGATGSEQTVLLLSSLGLAVAGSFALSMAPFAGRWEYGQVPDRLKLNQAARHYNHRLRKTLGLSTSPTQPKPKQRPLPVLAAYQ